MTKISIENFQSINKVDFDIEGFTVVIGKNNIGKSAIIRAIDAALNNQTGSGFIKKGKKKARVIVDYKDLNFEWEKTKSTASYKIKGYDEPFTKLKGTIPEPITKAGFRKMVIGDQKISPLIASQFDPLFLINKPGPVVTEVLANLYQIDTLSTADSLCQKAIKADKSLLKTREADLKALQIDLEKYKDFKTIKETVKLLAEKDKKAKELQEEIHTIRYLEGQLKSLTDILQRLKSIKDIEIPDSSKCKKVISELPWLQETDSKYKKSIEVIEKLKSIPEISIPNETKGKEILDEFEWIQEKSEKYKVLTSIVNKLKSISKIKIPKIEDTELSLNEVLSLKKWDDSLITTSENIRKQKNVLQSLNFDQIQKAINKVSLKLKDLTNMQSIEIEFLALVKSLKTTRDDLKKTTSELEKAQKEKNEIKVCPLCERPL